MVSMSLLKLTFSHIARRCIGQQNRMDRMVATGNTSPICWWSCHLAGWFIRLEISIRFSVDPTVLTEDASDEQLNFSKFHPNLIFRTSKLTLECSDGSQTLCATSGHGYYRLQAFHHYPGIFHWKINISGLGTAHKVWEPSAHSNVSSEVLKVRFWWISMISGV